MTDGQRAQMYRLAEQTRGRTPSAKQRKQMKRLRAELIRGRR